jgi:hypothetical protein
MCLLYGALNVAGLTMNTITRSSVFLIWNQCPRNIMTKWKTLFARPCASGRPCQPEGADGLGPVVAAVECLRPLCAVCAHPEGQRRARSDSGKAEESSRFIFNVTTCGYGCVTRIMFAWSKSGLVASNNNTSLERYQHDS